MNIEYHGFKWILVSSMILYDMSISFSVLNRIPFGIHLAPFTIDKFSENYKDLSRESSLGSEQSIGKYYRNVGVLNSKYVEHDIKE